VHIAGNSKHGSRVAKLLKLVPPDKPNRVTIELVRSGPEIFFEGTGIQRDICGSFVLKPTTEPPELGIGCTALGLGNTVLGRGGTVLEFWCTLLLERESVRI